MHLMRLVAFGRACVHVDRGVGDLGVRCTRSHQSRIVRRWLDRADLDSQHRSRRRHRRRTALVAVDADGAAGPPLRHPADGQDKRLFLFDDQVKDNLALTLVSAMLIGTLWESVGWWAYANDIAPMITWDEKPDLVRRALPARSGVVDRVLLGDALAASPWPRLHPRALVAPQERQRRAVVRPCDAPTRTRRPLCGCAAVPRVAGTSGALPVRDVAPLPRRR